MVAIPVVAEETVTEKDRALAQRCLGQEKRELLG